jgi:hypothetical protein
MLKCILWLLQSNWLAHYGRVGVSNESAVFRNNVEVLNFSRKAPLTVVCFLTCLNIQSVPPKSATSNNSLTLTYTKKNVSSKMYTVSNGVYLNHKILDTSCVLFEIFLYMLEWEYYLRLHSYMGHSVQCLRFIRSLEIFIVHYIISHSAKLCVGYWTRSWHWSYNLLKCAFILSRVDF